MSKYYVNIYDDEGSIRLSSLVTINGNTLRIDITSIAVYLTEDELYYILGNLLREMKVRRAARDILCRFTSTKTKNDTVIDLQKISKNKSYYVTEIIKTTTNMYSVANDGVIYSSLFKFEISEIFDLMVAKGYAKLNYSTYKLTDEFREKMDEYPMKITSYSGTGFFDCNEGCREITPIYEF